MTPRWLPALVFGQLLYSLGAAVATGPVLRYAVDDWRLPAFVFTLLLVLPELAQTAAVGCGDFVRRAASAKRLWLWTAVVARAVATVVGLGPWLDPANANPRVAWAMIALLGASEAVQAVSYVALVVWMSRVVDADRFGGVFGPRRLGVVGGLIAVPYLLDASQFLRGAESAGTAELLLGNAVAAAALAVLLLIPVDLWSGVSDPGPAARRNSGLAAAAVQSRPGGESSSLHGIRTTPLRRSPPAPGSETPDHAAAGVVAALRDPWARSLMFACWHLAAAQGLTQYVFFRYAADVLDVSAVEKTRLVAFMFWIQLPLAWVAGRLCDRFEDRRVFAAGVWLTAAAVPLWLLARPGGWTLYAAYGLWGAFSLVNVSIQTMSLRRSDESNRAEVVALVRFGGGVLAALTPLAVSPLLPDRVAAGAWQDPTSVWVWLMAASFAGRVTAPLWLSPRTRPD